MSNGLNMHPYTSVGKRHLAPTMRQNRQRSGKTLRNKAAFTDQMRRARIVHPVTVSYRSV